MVLASDRERVRSLLTETVVLLCKTSLDFETSFSVEALVGITIDESEIILINIKELMLAKKPDSCSEENESAGLKVCTSAGWPIGQDIENGQPVIDAMVIKDEKLENCVSDNLVALTEGGIDFSSAANDTSTGTVQWAPHIGKEMGHVKFDMVHSHRHRSIKMNGAIRLDMCRRLGISYGQKSGIESGDLNSEFVESCLDDMDLVDESGTSDPPSSNASHPNFLVTNRNSYNNQSIIKLSASGSVFSSSAAHPFYVPYASLPRIDNDRHLQTPQYGVTKYKQMNLSSSVRRRFAALPPSSAVAAAAVLAGKRYKMYKCPYCSRTLKCLRNLRGHMAAQHNETKQYPCGFCSKQFAYKTSLKAHLITVHNKLS